MYSLHEHSLLYDKKYISKLYSNYIIFIEKTTAFRNNKLFLEGFLNYFSFETAISAVQNKQICVKKEKADAYNISLSNICKILLWRMLCIIILNKQPITSTAKNRPPTVFSVHLFWAFYIQFLVKMSVHLVSGLSWLLLVFIGPPLSAILNSC